MAKKATLHLLMSASLVGFAAPAMASDGDTDRGTSDPSAEAKSEEERIADADFDAHTAELKGSLLQQTNRVFTKDDFTRFAPRTAYDMVRNIPGFSISGSDSSERGLGQASQNILLNGQRVSAKSNDAASTLSRIDADDVIRIEILDGATLDIPGLNGEVANIVYRTDTMGGTYEWRPIFRERIGHSIAMGEVALNGRSGKLQWNASAVAQRQFQGHWGPEKVLSPKGELLLLRDEYGVYPQNTSRLAGSITREADNGNILNANVSGGLQYFANTISGEIYDPVDFVGTEESVTDNKGWLAELGSDYEFALGDGRMKVIGLQRFEGTPVLNSFTATNDDYSEYRQQIDERESVVRSEYRWGDRVDWQVSLEGALNTLDSEASLFFTPGGGAQSEIPLPGANARVEEKRGEAILSYGRPIAEGLTMQLNLGGEYSRISVDGEAGNGARSYWRPKGSVSVAWRASPSLAVNAEIERKVDQLSFGNLLAAVDVANNTDRATNIELVPSQRWRGRVEVTKNVGDWATLKPFVELALIEDKVEIIPISPTEEALGNVDKARALFVGGEGTIELAQFGVNGARLSFEGGWQDTHIDDPLLTTDRPISQVLDYYYDVGIRHDVPGTSWAWGASVNRNRQTPLYRLDQVSFRYLTGHDGSLFVENKDVAGLTVRASIYNLFDGRDGFWRDVYQGRRTNPLAFREEQSREYGRILQLSVKGSI